MLHVLCITYACALVVFFMAILDLSHWSQGVAHLHVWAKTMHNHDSSALESTPECKATGSLQTNVDNIQTCGGTLHVIACIDVNDSLAMASMENEVHCGNTAELQWRPATTSSLWSVLLAHSSL